MPITKYIISVASPEFPGSSLQTLPFATICNYRSPSHRRHDLRSPSTKRLVPHIYPPYRGHLRRQHVYPSKPMSFFRRFFSAAPAINMSQAKETVQKYIDDNAVVVFSKTYCPYCKATKQTLKDLGADFLTVELDTRDDGAALQDALEEISGQRSVPNNYISKKHIGGNSDLQTLSKNGQLKKLVQAANAIKA
ncbi:Glutaredoxin-2 like protein [Verticillium longisporum]|uniref:Glutaredoxin-2 like protein n=3 Tax=Verticillium longisporum TaxID=100787 RepID=A0A8I2ZVJ4_VERLO|nr:Glutaredoxin-2 like protein [Verticillium longisporum]KAG7138688.1 Glutaredoxin-2 like protein [Verticillium longisporum]